MQAKIISVVSTKGGEGKTTICANLASIVADAINAASSHKRVLLCDFDTQPGLSDYFPYKHKADKGVYEMLSDGKLDESYISSLDIEGLDIIYSNDPTGSTIGQMLMNSADGRVRLRALLNSSFVNSRYDYVFIDSQGARGVLAQAAVFAATHGIAVPVKAATLGAKEFYRNTLQMIDECRNAARMMGFSAIAPIRVVLNEVSRTTESREVSKQVKEIVDDKASDLMRVARTESDSAPFLTLVSQSIPNLKIYKDSAAYQEPAHRRETERSGPYPPALEVFWRVLQEIAPEFADIDVHEALNKRPPAAQEAVNV